jgi:hypothetical protein
MQFIFNDSAKPGEPCGSLKLPAGLMVVARQDEHVWALRTNCKIVDELYWKVQEVSSFDLRGTRSGQKSTVIRPNGLQLRGPKCDRNGGK